jgi:hypothetical protein
MPPGEGDMGIVIAFPAERCSVGSGLIEARDDSGSVIILPVIRVERHGDNPSDGLEPSSSSPRGKRRKR